MVDKSRKYSNLTKKIIGCALKVHNTLGCGYQELIYQRALAIEFDKIGLKFAREDEAQILYNGDYIGTRRVDFFVEDVILVEIKAVMDLNGAHLAQAINYLEIFEKDIGLLINFGAQSLQFKRVLNKRIMTRKNHCKIT